MSGLAKPDIAGGADGIVSETFYKYPKDSLVSAVKTPPGKGGVVTAFVFTTAPAPGSAEQNSALANINKLLNADLRVTVVTSANDYFARFATIMAGSPSDYPDLLWIRDVLNVKGVNQFLKASYADLAPYLAGDAVKAFPGIANLPPYSWPNTVRNGTIQAIPRNPVNPWGDQAYINQAFWDEVGGLPKNIDDFTRMAKAMTRPQQGRYAIVDTLVSSSKSPGLRAFFLNLFGAPNQWRVTKGKLVKDLETDEYRAAAEYVRSLYAAGVVHPDAATLSNAQASDLLLSGKAGFIGQFGVTAFPDRWLANKGKIPLRALMPFGHDGKAQPNYHFGSGSNGTTAIKKGSEDRVKELLGIVNLLASPFGTTEYHASAFGIPGVHSDYDADGNPVLTQKGRSELLLSGVRFCAEPTYSTYQPKEFAALQGSYQNTMRSLGIADPTIGLDSATNVTARISLDRLTTDTLLQIVTGRQPMGAFDQFIKDWRSQGGDAIRQEFEEALARRGN